MDATCDLCGREAETVQHLLIRCPALEIHRSSIVAKLIDLYRQQGVTPHNEEDEIVSNYKNLDPIILQKNTGSAANKLCNLLCLKLARERDLLLQGDTLDATLTIRDSPGQPEQPGVIQMEMGPKTPQLGNLCSQVML